VGRWLANTRPVTRLLDLRAEARVREGGMLAAAFQYKQINRVAGDYLEFGLWQGKTFSHAHRLRRRYRVKDMELWGFDSFAGLPEIDDASDNVWAKGDFACSEAQFRRLLRRRGIAEHEYHLVPGFYKDSLNEAVHERLAGRCAAIVYIDCDLYASTVDVLRFVARYLVNGTVVCFDDFFYCYKAAPDQGEQRALAEFLSDHKEYTFIPWMDYCPVGKAFIVRVAIDDVR
jgi:hypothetical protein